MIPFRGRGVALVRPEHGSYAVEAAQAACAVHRHEQDADKRMGEGLIVSVNVGGLLGYEVPAGPLDRVPIILVPAGVAAGRIVGMERVSVPLPLRGSFDDRLLRTGMACHEDDGLARRSVELVERLGILPRCLGASVR